MRESQSGDWTMVPWLPRSGDTWKVTLGCEDVFTASRQVILDAVADALPDGASVAFHHGVWKGEVERAFTVEAFGATRASVLTLLDYLRTVLPTESYAHVVKVDETGVTSTWLVTL